jgi:hypothetical protein
MEELEIVQGKVFDVIGVVDATIAQMDTKYLALKINGVTDKKGYEAVHEGRMLYLHTRTKIEKEGLRLRKKAKATIEDYLTEEQKEERRILALLKPGEDRLSEEEKAYTDALEAIRLEKVRQENERIQARRDRLAAISVGFNGQVWTDGKTSLPEPLLKAANDNQFEEYYFKFHEAAEAEKKRLEAERIAKEEEAARVAKIAAEQDVERKRLEAIAKEQAEKEAARLADIEAERRRKETQDRLEQAEREKQEALVKAAANALARDKAEWERIKAEELRAQEAAKQKIIDDERRVEQARIDVEAKIKREADEKAAKELAAKIAAEKKEQRRPDKEKLLGYVKVLAYTAPPQLKTAEAKDILIDFEKKLGELLDKLSKEASEL